jgi:hypothetical protein
MVRTLAANYAAIRLARINMRAEQRIEQALSQQIEWAHQR